MEGYQIALIVIAAVIVLLFFGRFYFNGPWATKKDLTGKTIVITGSSAGIGLLTALSLLKSNANVVFACRNRQKTEKLIGEIPEEGNKKNATFMQLDLCSFNSVRRFVDEAKEKNLSIDILINNAGLLAGNKAELTDDGIELTWQSNHFGHFLLTELLIRNELFNNKEARIINLSSMVHKAGKLETLKSLFNSTDLGKNFFNGMVNSNVFSDRFQIYSDTKLANVVYTVNLFKRFGANNQPNLRFFSNHPGVVASDFLTTTKESIGWCMLGAYYISYPFFWYFSKSSEAGAQTTLYLCYEEEKNLRSGKYYKDCGYTPYDNKSEDPDVVDSLYNFSNQITNLEA